MILLWIVSELHFLCYMFTNVEVIVMGSSHTPFPILVGSCVALNCLVLSEVYIQCACCTSDFVCELVFTTDDEFTADNDATMLSNCLRRVSV